MNTSETTVTYRMISPATAHSIMPLLVHNRYDHLVRSGGSTAVLNSVCECLMCKGSAMPQHTQVGYCGYRLVGRDGGWGTCNRTRQGLGSRTLICLTAPGWVIPTRVYRGINNVGWWFKYLHAWKFMYLVTNMGLVLEMGKVRASNIARFLSYLYM